MGQTMRQCDLAGSAEAKRVRRTAYGGAFDVVDLTTEVERSPTEAECSPTEVETSCEEEVSTEDRGSDIRNSDVPFVFAVAEADGRVPGTIADDSCTIGHLEGGSGRA